MRTLLADRVSAGYHNVVWNGMDNDGRPAGFGRVFSADAMLFMATNTKNHVAEISYGGWKPICLHVLMDIDIPPYGFILYRF